MPAVRMLETVFAAPKGTPAFSGLRLSAAASAIRFLGDTLTADSATCGFNTGNTVSGRLPATGARFPPSVPARFSDADRPGAAPSARARTCKFADGPAHCRTQRRRTRANPARQPHLHPPRIRGQTPAALGQTLPHILPHILRQTLIFRG
ncbi:Uncharacterised protein [Neisseria gonorrhoeae]|uniref:Uncharacterized protein n=1 Tax=Neisseria gonorrhoeae TaxID=485 RepID=A0A378VV25_NEIGO|nr:Uncharacterised protein [Neisseria gonorrhoeae]